MPNWTYKQALSEFMSKFRRSDREESPISSSAEAAPPNEPTGDFTADEEIQVSPLALKNESSPEAWLGRFLQMLDMPNATNRATLAGAQSDPALTEQLRAVRDAAGQDEPLRLLDAAQAAELKQRDWAGWWKGQETLGKYCYSVLALVLLGDKSHMPDLEAMYEQGGNARIQKDAHYTLCYLLGKEWPTYEVTQADFARLGGA